MGLYCRFEDVRLRVVGKVRFTEDPELAGEGNKMPIALANRLILEAEGQVETDLSPRYMTPFQTTEGAAYSRLPVRPTQEVLRTLCEIQSVIRVLETDFGSGTVVDADKYCGKLKERYDATVKKLLETKDESYMNRFIPPLPGLRLAFHNEGGDDGFSGTIFHINSDNQADFASRRINNPSETYWNVTWDNLLSGQS